MYIFLVLMTMLTSIAESMSANFICDYICSKIRKHNDSK